MWRDLIVATAVAAAAGLASLLYDRYAYWRAYAPNRFAGGVALFALANAAAGAFGVAAAAALNWEPRPGSWAFNGFIYGVVGQGLARIEPRAPNLRYVEAGRSILARASQAVERLLDVAAEIGIQRRLNQLSDQQLYDQAMYLHGKYVAPDETLPQRARTQQKKQLVDAAQMIAEGNPEGRGRLERHCIDEISNRRLPPDLAWMAELAEP